MNGGGSTRSCARLVTLLVAMALAGCSGRKQVPFGLTDAGTPSEETAAQEEQAAQPSIELPVGETFPPDQVEVPLGEASLVLEKGYALGLLRLELDGAEPTDAIVVSTEGQQVSVVAAFERGLGVTSRRIDSFLVPEDCEAPSAAIRQLSESLVSVQVDHQCAAGLRSNVWVLTIEAQPRVRERITVLPPSPQSPPPIAIELGVEDRDADGYDDVVARVQIGDATVPLTWLNRPGGFARDPSEPEASMRLLADDAWAFLDSDPAGSAKRANDVIAVFVALCRESGAARMGLTGTQGVQCGASPSAARAVAVAMVAAIRRGQFVRALELQRWWSRGATQPTAEERSLVQQAWQQAKAGARASWQRLSTESANATLYFRDRDTLIIDGSAPRLAPVGGGETIALSNAEVMPPIRSPDGRFVVRGVRVTCAGYEAEVGPARGKRTHRVLIERRPGTIPCQTPIDRRATPFEWSVLGWAPQGLVAATGDRLRVVPLNELGKPAGTPIDLDPGSPLPAPIAGPRVTPNGERYVIPHPQGLVVRDWRKGGTGLWLRPVDWDAVPGEVRAVAIDADGKRIAVQKGSEIRLVSW